MENNIVNFHTFFLAGMKRHLPPVERNTNCKIINLGGGLQSSYGSILDLPQWNANKDSIPYEDGEIGVINAFHFLEHVDDPIAVLQECERVLEFGGIMNIVVPYYSSALQAQDLTHKHAFTEETWKTLFKKNEWRNPTLYGDHWKFEVGFNMIAGINERNLCLMTQLIKTER